MNLQGERSPSAKLTTEQAQGILALRPAKWEDRRISPFCKEVAETYGVSTATIVRIWRRAAWAHLEIK